MNYLNTRRCAICGGLVALTFVGGLPAEVCPRDGMTACPQPIVHWAHGSDPEPHAPPVVRQSYVLGTSTATATTISVPGI
ncbi:MAG TPA: hypothetical protein VNZ53_03375 [Steroidobacteraceae bacterium]|nr:hypothetical protein [Steroidobacteraceae bacterium]